jgi:leucyl-tRNA synthetase
MFIGPWDQGGGWSDRGLIGVSRWLNRVWNLVLEPKGDGLPQAEQATLRELRRVVHRTIRKATEDLKGFHFNTMVAALMEFSNYLASLKGNWSVDSAIWQEAIDALLLLLAPIAPHLAEELWVRTGHPYSIHSQPFPTWDEGLVAAEEFTLVIEVDGKVRDKVTVPVSITEEEARRLALSRERIRGRLNEREIERIIYVPGRLLNVVLK